VVGNRNLSHGEGSRPSYSREIHSNGSSSNTHVLQPANGLCPLLQSILAMIRHSLFSAYRAFRSLQLEQINVVEHQEQLLLSLVRKAASTQFAKAHEFSSIDSVHSYQSRVPLRSYEQFWDEYWKDSFPRLMNVSWPGTIEYFPVSSGTSSGTSKNIPLSRSLLLANHKAALDIFVHHFSHRPHSRCFFGKTLVLGGSTELDEVAPGIASGDLSGIVASTIPWWAQRSYFPKEDISLIKDWNQKIKTLARAARFEDIRVISGIPNWLIKFFEACAELRGLDTVDMRILFPHLELIIHGGVNFLPYQSQFERMLDGSNAEMREVYPASEGFLGIADGGSYNSGLRLLTDHGIFFEFVPIEELTSPRPTRHWVRSVERDRDYAMVLTTSAGLWSYVLGDTVRFLSTSPHRLLVTGRTSYYLSAFGEHLLGSQIDNAVDKACRSHGLEITDYSVGTVFSETSASEGRHLYIIECASVNGIHNEAPHFANVLASEIDSHLSKLNDDYRILRKSGYSLSMPSVWLVEPESFASWMEARGKLGGQNKVPRIINRSELLDHLGGYMESRTVARSHETCHT
jgi:GH3 auxin-responsive promoter